MGRKGETDEGAGTEEGWTPWSQEHVSEEKGRVVGVDSSLHITLESVSRRSEALKKRKESPCGDLCLLQCYPQNCASVPGPPMVRGAGSDVRKII